MLPNWCFDLGSEFCSGDSEGSEFVMCSLLYSWLLLCLYLCLLALGLKLCMCSGSAVAASSVGAVTVVRSV